MKTHILFATLTALLLTACASHEGRKVASETPEQKQEDAFIFNRTEPNADHELHEANSQ